MKYVHELSYLEFNDFYHDILPTGNLGKTLRGFIFRGESTSSYKLLPTSLRIEKQQDLWKMSRIADVIEKREFEDNQIMAELHALKNFYKLANNQGLPLPSIKDFICGYDDVFSSSFFPNKMTEWLSTEFVELAALAQHFGVMTRLLDWTYNFHVALYFASIGACKRKEKNGLIENDKIILWALDVEFIQTLEYPYSPLRFIVPSYAMNKNIYAQQGILSHWILNLNDKNKIKSAKIHRVNRTPLDELIENHEWISNKPILYKISLPVSNSNFIFSFLYNLGYSASKIFPGYNNIVREMEEYRFLVRI